MASSVIIIVPKTVLVVVADIQESAVNVYLDIMEFIVYINAHRHVDITGVTRRVETAENASLGLRVDFVVSISIFTYVIFSDRPISPV